LKLTESKFILPAYKRDNEIIEHTIVNDDWTASVAEAVIPIVPTFDM